MSPITTSAIRIVGISDETLCAIDSYMKNPFFYFNVNSKTNRDRVTVRFAVKHVYERIGGRIRRFSETRA